ncbi:uncharacterized protein PV09_07097 [Verruconis gallopava]|uniref:Aquaporin n=1 Tax=Verruconis gallopava TaxID=253628 RepID=A0A0D1YKC2_9PEZI|nr:uncharacterized protein PV09_07097 [Verruconis gallopava]KIW01322.1 hypothetical protein PV09_07097 [Verruconis gallopava]
MTSVPPIPPLKSSQRLSLPANLSKAPSVRIVDNPDGSLSFSEPSPRRLGRSQNSDDDPRRIAQNAVRQAAGGSGDRPILDRGRPKIGPPETPQRQDSARSPPGTRTPFELDLDDGFSYIEDDADIVAASQARFHSPTKVNTVSTQATTRTQARPQINQQLPPPRRNGSFGNGKPRGLSFQDARQFMRSGRIVRPGSWYEGPSPITARAAEIVSAAPTTTISRSRSLSPQVPRARSRSPVERMCRDEEEGFPSVKFELSSCSDQGEGSRDSTLPPKRASSKSPRKRPLLLLARSHLVAAIGEFMGTMCFLFTAFGGVSVAAVGSRNSSRATENSDSGDANLSGLLYMSFAFGISYLINVWVFFRASEGLFNPAVTLAFLLTRTNDLARSIVLLVSQLMGAIAASALALALFQTIAPLRTTPSDDVSIPRALFIEAAMTAQLVLTILMLAREKHRTTSVAPLGIGLALVFGELVGIFWTGGSLNPARSFGPNVVSWNWKSNHWIYWIGPFVGSLIAVTIHRILIRLAHVLGARNHRNDVHLAQRHQMTSVSEKENENVANASDNAMTSKALQSFRYTDSDLTGIINLWHRSSIQGERGLIVESADRRAKL